MALLDELIKRYPYWFLINRIHKLNHCCSVILNTQQFFSAHDKTNQEDYQRLSRLNLSNPNYLNCLSTTFKIYWKNIVRHLCLVINNKDHFVYNTDIHIHIFALSPRQFHVVSISVHVHVLIFMILLMGVLPTVYKNMLGC